MSFDSTLQLLLTADELTPAFDEHTWLNFVEHVVETLDVGPGTTVWDAGCGAGAFLYPLSLNGYIVGGIDSSADRLALAREAMPQGRFVVGSPMDFDPADPWDVVVASHGFSQCRNLGDVRGLLARMVAKATHAVAALRVDEASGPAVGRTEILRLLAEIGVSAAQFEAADGQLQVYVKR